MLEFVFRGVFVFIFIKVVVGFGVLRFFMLLGNAFFDLAVCLHIINRNIVAALVVHIGVFKAVAVHLQQFLYLVGPLLNSLLLLLINRLIIILNTSIRILLRLLRHPNILLIHFGIHFAILPQAVKIGFCLLRQIFVVEMTGAKSAPSILCVGHVGWGRDLAKGAVKVAVGWLVSNLVRLLSQY